MVKTGKDEYDRRVAVCYLDDNGNPGKNFKRQPVDIGNAAIKDFKNNEYDPQDWWLFPQQI